MIRPYAKEDQATVIGLLRLNTPKYFDATEEQEFVDYLDTDAENYFVLEEDGKIVASAGINYFPEDAVARIAWDVVHPEYQGRGLGKELTLFRIDQIKKKLSVRTIIVRTSQLAYRFYQKLGFTIEKTEADYWAPGFDLYLMSLTLPDHTSHLNDQDEPD